MKKQRVYIDTSVFGRYFDSEFEEFTKPLFDRIKNGEFVIWATILNACALNIERVRGYNSINIKNGYKQLEIHSPRDLMNYGNEE